MLMGKFNHLFAGDKIIVFSKVYKHGIPVQLAMLLF